jgi:hypothetical protein
MVPLPEMSYVVAGLDTAMSERETADWSAMATFGVFHRRKNEVRKAEPWFSGRWAAGACDLIIAARLGGSMLRNCSAATPISRQ